MKLTILGATGSIGVSTLDVLARHPERYEVMALTGNHQIDLLAEQCVRFKPKYAVVGDAIGAAKLQAALGQRSVKTEVAYGAEALEQVASLTEVDAVMAAIVGAAGLAPTLAAARAGKRILLANKEALVMAGSVFMDIVRRSGVEYRCCWGSERVRWGDIGAYFRNGNDGAGRGLHFVFWVCSERI